MQRNPLLVVICCAALLLDVEVSWADSNEEAVKKSVHQQIRGNTDVDGDGLAIMPVTLKRDGKTLVVSGEILHTWTHYEPTPIRYEVTINQDGTASGTVVVNRVKNPDGEALKNDQKGHLSGKIGSLKCDILTEHRAMRGAVKLIGMVLEEAKM